MEAVSVQVTEEQKQFVDALKANPKLLDLFKALIAVAQSGDLSAPARNIANAVDTLPAAKTAPKMTIEKMKEVLRAADCLYDNPKHWKQLGATTVPMIPNAVIRGAYKKGGRVILRCSSISKKANALLRAGHPVYFSGDAKQSDYKKVSKPEWIVVPSHIDTSTLGSPKSTVVTSKMPAPTPEDLFSMSAYARLDVGRQPEGYEGLYAFTNQSRTVVGSRAGLIFVLRVDHYVRYGAYGIGAARFGPPRN